MTAHEFRTVAAFDTALHVGQRVMIHWTNSHRWYDAAATVTKVNAKSVLAAIDDAIYGTFGAAPTLLYPAGHVIKAPRLTDMKSWTANNCVTPLDDDRREAPASPVAPPKPRIRIRAIARQVA